MQNSATIVSLTGEAWARSANGSLRALRVGDRLAPDEVLITGPGARVDLDFGAAGQTSVVGEHSVPVAQLAPEPEPEDEPLLDSQPERAPEQAGPVEEDDGGSSDGHGFVQLPRIEEPVEADGMTPLTLSRVVEPLDPAGMALAGIGADVQAGFEHVGREFHGPEFVGREFVDVQGREVGAFLPPEASISIDVIAGDDVINAAEAAGSVIVSGRVGLDVKPGDTVTLTVGDRTYTTTVNADGQTWSVEVPGAVLVGESFVHASVTTSNAAGLTAGAEAARPYEVDVVPPGTTVIPPQAGEDAVPFSFDIGAFFSDPGRLSFDATGLPPGLSIDPVSGEISGTPHRSASQGGPGADGVYTVTVTVTDSAGNPATETFEITVTNPAPEANDDAGVTDERSVVTGNVLTNDNDPDGDPLTVVEADGQPVDAAGTQIPGDNGGVFTLYPDGSYSFDPNGDFDSLGEGDDAQTSITYTISDGEGGFYTATLTITVDGLNDAPTLVAVPDLDFTEDPDASAQTLSASGVVDFDDIDDGDVLNVSASLSTPAVWSGGTLDPALKDALEAGFSVTPVAGGGAPGSTPWGYEVNGVDLDFLSAGETIALTYTITVEDSAGATATDEVTITITGTNDAPTITPVPAISFTEAADASAQDLAASGSVTLGDLDANDRLTLSTQYNNDIAWDGGALDPALAQQLVEGFSAAGSDLAPASTPAWSYNVTGVDLDFLAAGETISFSYTLTVTDSQGESADEVVTVTITGTGDDAVISGDSSGAVTEAGGVGNDVPGTPQTGGTLTIRDPDHGEDHFQTPAPADLQGTYGDFTFDPLTGEWTYTLDNDRTATQALAEGEVVSETLTVTSADGSASETITVTVTGSNDVPEVTDDSGSVSKDPDNTPGTTLETSGTLDITDLDQGESEFDTASLEFDATNSDGAQLGTLTIDANGDWEYSVDNSDPRVQGLGGGESITQVWTVKSADGTATSTITVTITGTNSEPVIDVGASTLDAAITEIEDGHVDENVVTHVETGTLTFIDADVNDEHTVTFAPNDTGYLGSFELGTVDQVNDTVGWTFRVDDSVLDSLAHDETLVQEYVVTITDKAGATATETVTITLVGTNDRPELEDDLSLTAAGEAVVADVLANDHDVDDGDMARWAITEVDGQAIAPGGSVSLTSGEGTVTLQADGRLHFAPAPGVTGPVAIDYTVDDGSGAANSAATATWTVNVIGVDIQGDADPNGALDDALSSVDDLDNVQISGWLPPAGTLTGLSVASLAGGTTPVSIDPATVTINPDGSFTTTVDLSHWGDGAGDGTLTVTLEVEDAGESATTTDTIFMDTVTEVAIDPIAVVNGEVPPALTGTGEPGAEVEIFLEGVTQGTVTVAADGTWSHTWANPLAVLEREIEAVATDVYGNTASAERHIASLELNDGNAGEIGHVTVYEAGLSDGSDSDSDSDVAFGHFVLGLEPATDPDVLTVHGTDISSTQLKTATILNPIVIPVGPGELRITSYDTISGQVNFIYALTDDHDHGGDDDFLQEITITVLDADGDSRTDTLGVRIVDDAPVAEDGDQAEVSEGGETVAWDSVGQSNLLTNDTQGADGAQVHEIRYTDADGDPATVLVSDAGTTVTTQHGQLTVWQNGNWSFTSASVVDHGAYGDGDQRAPADFDYRLIDGDGSLSDWATQPIDVIDTEPTIDGPENASVDEKHLQFGTDPDGDALTVTGSLGVQSGADPIDTRFTSATIAELENLGLKSDGVDLSYVLTDAHTITASAGDKAIFTVIITNPTSDSAGYEFELQGPLDHPEDSGTFPNLVLEFPFTVIETDSDGDSADGSFTVDVIHDQPADQRAIEVDEDDTVTFNASADATSDNTTIVGVTGTPDGDGNVVYEVTCGTVTVNANGTITYDPDLDYSGADSFTYRTVTGGATIEVTVDVTVNPVSDAPTVEADKLITTDEDVAVALGLQAPVVTDDTDQNGAADGDNPERLSAISLSADHDADVQLLHGDGSAVLDSNGDPVLLGGTPITIVLTDDPLRHIEGAAEPDTLKMTQAQFEALQVLPPEHRHENFKVTLSVLSHEVDDAGVPLAGVPGAESTQVIDVQVLAVTDPISLEIGNDTDGWGTSASYDLFEDNTFNLHEVLRAAFEDLDGSEERALVIEGLPNGAFINGVEVGADGTVTIPGNLSATTDIPELIFRPPEHYSGTLAPITITLRAQDLDGDAGDSDGDELTASVTVEFHVYPVVDGFNLLDVTTPEDTGVAFLDSLELIDTDGSETITAIEIEDIPAGWKIFDGTTELHDGSSDSFTLSPAQIGGGAPDAPFRGFTLLPPAHSSADATLNVKVAINDTATVNDVLETRTAEFTESLTVTVTPVAEEVGGDSDGDGILDLTMPGDFTYSSHGEEDAWFALNADGFDPGAASTDTSEPYSGWSNQDGDEEIYAVLTPELKAQSGSGPVSAVGSKFRYSTNGDTTEEGGAWVELTYVGTPLEVPVEYLSTLEFKAAPYFSGMFYVHVQAKTVDTDPDTGATHEAISGNATWHNLVIAPKANDVTLAGNQLVLGDEDSEIPLVIRPSSDDPAETFDVTLSGIPSGAKLFYGGVEQSAEPDGSYVIESFDVDTALTVLPPPHSNENFQIAVSAESVDILDLSGFTPPVAPPAGETEPVFESRNPVSDTLQIDVEVTGVADEVTFDTPIVTYVEADLDDGSAEVQLSSLVTNIHKVDDDGSETLTFKITGLEPGFAVEGATFQGGSGTGRAWVLTESQLASATIRVPANFSGEVRASITAITTENDGNSLTGDPQTFGFNVEPSPEALLTLHTEGLKEDVIGKVNLGIRHQNGDTDETVEEVWISKASIDAAHGLTLYIGHDPAVSIADAAADAGNADVIDDGGYYKLSGAALNNLYAKGGPNWHGTVELDIHYWIKDSAADGSMTTIAETETDIDNGISATYTLEIDAVTDPVTTELDALTADASGNVTVDGASNTVTVEGPGGTVTVSLAVGKAPDPDAGGAPDHDGSERTVQVIIDGVPVGVTVEDGYYLGPDEDGTGRWLLEVDQAIDDTTVVNVVFNLVGEQLFGSDSSAELRMRVGTQDEGAAYVEGPEVVWALETVAGEEGEGEEPAEISSWEAIYYDGVEDTSFTLDEVVSAEIIGSSAFTITLSELPAGAQVSGPGVVSTFIGSEPVWIVHGAGDDAALQARLGQITITPPENWNDNNQAGEPPFKAVLTTQGTNGASFESEAYPKPDLTPVSDAPQVAISAADVDEGEELRFDIALSNPADGTFAEPHDGRLFLRLSETSMDAAGGTLSYGATELVAQYIDDVPGLPADWYYVVTGAELGEVLPVHYQPADHASGSVELQAWFQSREQDADASDVAIGSGSHTAQILPVNSGYDAEARDIEGYEDTLIALDFDVHGLHDADGSESLLAVLLRDVPDGFLVYYGDDASNHQLARNTGGDASGNTWSIPLDSNGEVPAFIGVRPPQHWSGNTDLALVFVSREDALEDPEETALEFTLDVTPVSDGITIAPTLTFGLEGAPIPINLNLAMPDEDELVSLTLKGLGKFAGFYYKDAGDQVLITDVDYDGTTDTYTLSGLTADQAKNLSFIQAAQAGNTPYNVEVSAWTVDGDDTSSVVNSSFEARIRGLLPTTDDDVLLYNGRDINGLDGDDVVQLRYGESIDFDSAPALRNIEALDLRGNGENALNGLTIEDVLDMTDSRNELKIFGDSEDSVMLLSDGDANWQQDGTWVDGDSGVTFNVYHDGDNGLSLLIQQGVLVE